MRRELAIALRAPITWVIAALSALLVGHGFVLALDIYSASSRSALQSALQAREMDPLAGIVRPTLGGLDLAVSLLVPLVAARLLSVEKERHTFGGLCLLEGSPDRVVWKKLAAAGAAASLLFVAPVALFAAYSASGGHLDALETGWALLGEVLHAALVVAVSIAAAAWTRTLAQAATIGIVVSLTSWALDAAEGFAALAWLGGASAWSVERKLGPFQRGIVSLGSLGWMVVATALSVTIAMVGARFDQSRGRKAAVVAGATTAAAALLMVSAASHRAWDWTEQRRASLPPAAVEGLRGIPEPLSVDVFLDRDDSRRRQLESDALAKLFLARPDLVVHIPLDDERAVAEAQRDTGYGRIVVHVGSSTRETRSTSRRELVSLIFDAAGLPLPDWTQPPYRGYPFVSEGTRRTVLVSLAYLAVPLALLGAGFVLTRRRFVR